MHELLYYSSKISTSFFVMCIGLYQSFVYWKRWWFKLLHWNSWWGMIWKKKSYLFLYLNLTPQSIEQWRKKLSLLFKIFDELDEFVAEWLGVELGIERSWVRSTLWGFRWWRLFITAYSIGPFVGISQERQDPRWQPVLISRGYLG